MKPPIEPVRMPCRETAAEEPAQRAALVRRLIEQPERLRTEHNRRER